MFIAKRDSELTQVDFWNLYKDVFTPFQDRQALLVASDVIKNVNVVFPQAQAMVLAGPPQRFVVRGVDRRKDIIVTERFKCLWDRSQCTQTGFDSPQALYEHVLQHLESLDEAQIPCLWATCPGRPLPKYALKAHILTHFSMAQPPSKPPSQSDTITLPSENYPYPSSDPTTRPLPPQRNTTITYRRPVVDPPWTPLKPLPSIRFSFQRCFRS